MLTVTTPANRTQLCSVELLQRVLGAADSEGPLLEHYIDAATAAIQDYTRRTFCTQTYEEKLPAANDTRLVLARMPVGALTSVTYKGRDYTSSVVVEDADSGIVFKEDGFIGTTEFRGYLLSEPYGVGPSEWTFTYTAGYRLPGDPSSVTTPKLPSSVSQACLRLATSMYQSRQRDPALKSEEYGGGSYELSDAASKGAMPADVLAALRVWRLTL